MESWFGVFIFVLLISWVKSEPNFRVHDNQAELIAAGFSSTCSLTECQQLRDRVETLEAAVRTIVSALANQKGRQFTPINKILKQDPALIAVFSKSPTSANSVQNKTQLPNEDGDKDSEQIDQKEISTLNQLKKTMKCSLANLLDINSSEETNINPSGRIQATLSANNSLEIKWTPLSNKCIKFNSGFWVRIFESASRPPLSSKSYLAIPQNCLNQSPNSNYSIILHSPTTSGNNKKNETCHFELKEALIQCHSYTVEVIPNYQSLKGKPLITKISIPITNQNNLVSMSLIDFSINSTSFTFSWKDSSSCAPQLTSLYLKIFPDSRINRAGDDINSSPLKIPRSCLKMQHSFANDENQFSLALSPNTSCPIDWKPLDQCRKYIFEVTPEYSIKWSGAPLHWEAFTTHLAEPSSFQKLDSEKCSNGRVHCQDASRDQSGNIVEIGKCIPEKSICDGKKDCSNGFDEFNCDNQCTLKFRCGRQCIDYENVCDKKLDCLDGSDEEKDTCDFFGKTWCKQLTTDYGLISSVEHEDRAENNELVVHSGKSFVLISVQANLTIWLSMFIHSVLSMGEDIYYVKVYDGPFSTSPLLLSHRGSTNPPSIRSSHNELYFEFMTLHSLKMVISYVAMNSTGEPFIPGCGGYVYGEGDISAPNFFSPDYSDVTDCVWYLETWNMYPIILLRKNIVESNSTKNFPNLADHLTLTVYDGWSPLGQVLYDERDSRNTPKNVVSSISQKMLIQFRPKPNVASAGQDNGYISWTVMSIPKEIEIVENLDGASGTIKSQNYPKEEYPNTMDYRWNITTVPDSKIQITFVFFETQEGFDYVYVYDGPTITSPLLLEKSGSPLLPFTVTSSTNKLLIRFTTDDYISLTGFLALYSVV